VAYEAIRYPWDAQTRSCARIPGVAAGIVFVHPTRRREKRTEPYTPAEGGWVKVKHRDYWRFGQGLESPGGAVLD